MKNFLFIFFLCFASCNGGGYLMTHSDFDEVQIGTSPKDLTIAYGTPYETHRRNDGSVEYEYVERIDMGGRTVEERHYFFLVREGKVVSKRMEMPRRSSPPRNSFDLQTSERETSSADLSLLDGENRPI